MDAILNFIRDQIVGIPYFVLVAICVFLIFAIIGYLVSLKYRSIAVDNIYGDNYDA